MGKVRDLAERLWSPDWRKTSWRDPRTIPKGERIEVVIGFDQVIAALGANGEGGVAEKPRASWLLRDKCQNGLGALVPEDAGISMRLGSLIAFRASADDAGAADPPREVARREARPRASRRVGRRPRRGGGPGVAEAPRDGGR